MTTSEIAAEHGVSRQTVHAHRKRGVFPQPVEGEGSTRPRFRADEVAAFFAANPPTPGKRTDLSRDEGVAVEASRLAVPPGRVLEEAQQFVEWLRVQLDEDERIARAADAELSAVFMRVDSFDPEMAADERHIMLHRPARVLREIDAKRQILDLYANPVADRGALRARMREVLGSDPDAFGRLHRQEGELIEVAERFAPVARLLALPYADRPGYREEWRP
jgi:hypothetical protein